MRMWLEILKMRYRGFTSYVPVHSLSGAMYGTPLNKSRRCIMVLDTIDGNVCLQRLSLPYSTKGTRTTIELGVDLSLAQTHSPIQSYIPGSRVLTHTRSRPPQQPAHRPHPHCHRHRPLHQRPPHSAPLDQPPRPHRRAYSWCDVRRHQQ